MTDKTAPSTLTDADLDMSGGVDGTFKFFKPNEPIKDSYELAGKRDIGTGAKPLPSEQVTLGYTEVEWTY